MLYAYGPGLKSPLLFMLAANSISLSDFNSVLGRYQDHINAISESKGSKQNAGATETLKELDVHRLSTIPDRLAQLKSLPDENISLHKEEVGQLIKWKL